MYSANEHITGSGLASLLLGPDYGSVVRVVYSDESGVGSERDEPLTVIAGLMLNMDSQWHPVLESIEDVLANCIGEEKIATYEIRGRNLYHKIKIGDDEASKLMALLMNIPSQHHVPVFYGAVDRAGFRYFRKKIFLPTMLRDEYKEEDIPLEPEETFCYALQECMGKVDAFVHTVFPREQVLWIHDKGRYDEDAKRPLYSVRKLAGEDVWRELQEKYHGVFSYPARSHIVDTIYFGKSEDSRAIQLADVACSTIVRYLRGDPIAIPYYQLLRSQIISEGTRPIFEDIEKGHEGMLAWTVKKKRSQPKS